MTQELFDFDRGILQSAFEGEAINLIVEWEHDSATIGMFHLHVAALAVNFGKAHALQSRMNLFAGEKRQLHSVSATTSWVSSCRKS